MKLLVGLAHGRTLHPSNNIATLMPNETADFEDTIPTSLKS